MARRLGIGALVALVLAGCGTPAAVAPSFKADWKALESRPLPKPKSGVDLIQTCAIGAEFDTDNGTPPTRFFAEYPAAPPQLVSVQGPTEIPPGITRPLTLSSRIYLGPAVVKLTAIKGSGDGTVGTSADMPQAALRLQVQPGLQLHVYAQVPGPGCYALRIDAPGFAEIMVFRASQPNTKPTPIATTAGQVLVNLRGLVLGVDPILLPAAADEGWRADVIADRASYSVRYTAPNGGTFLLGTVIPNPPPYMNQGHPNFRGDPDSFYEWRDAADPRTDRNLLWSEPGSQWKGAPTKTGQVMFYLTATGATDSEFWAFANSLHRVGP